jgi:cation diffusion facilitator CzcD-associated flavoprotein CzcO
MNERHHIVIVGAGFSGLGMAAGLRRRGIEDFVVLERADEVGGTWQANTYPGCRCDVPSHLYSFSFAPNPDWSHTYSAQPEIRDYLSRCADELGLRPHLRTGVAVEAARWDDAASCWEIETTEGTYVADVMIGAMGPLTEPKYPDVPGLDTFAGHTMHSARWDHDYDLRGKRVASIGTGASAIQYVPEIAPDVEQLYVFQRTAPWVVPHGNRPISARKRALYGRVPAVQRLIRGAVYASRESLVVAMAKRPRLLGALERMGRKHLERQVSDPQLREQLRPDFSLGCKRILPSNRWYRALQRDNVELVCSELAEVRPHAVVDRDGVEHEVDAIVFGTGFHVTDPPAADVVYGRDGVLLADVWRGSPRAYLGTAVPDFPNLFLLLGPNTGLGHSSVVYMIESQIEHVLRAIDALQRSAAPQIEVRPEAVDAFNSQLDAQLRGTVWASGCSSFYVDATGRNSTLWPDYTWRFRRLATHFDPAAYALNTPTREAVPA